MLDAVRWYIPVTVSVTAGDRDCACTVTACGCRERDCVMEMPYATELCGVAVVSDVWVHD